MTEEAKRCVEIIRYCSTGNDGNHCKECPYLNSDTLEKPCVNILFSDAANMIESLSEQLEQTENKLSELLSYVTGGRFSKADYSIDDMRRFVDDYNQSECNECDQLEYVNNERDGLNIMLAQAQAMLETRTKERDAAIKDLNYAGSLDGEFCSICKHQEREACEKRKFEHMHCWEWRGVEVE